MSLLGHLRSVRSLSKDELRMSEQMGYSYVDRLEQLEEDLLAQGVYVKEGSRLFRMSKFKQPSAKALALSKKNMRMIEATRYLKNQYNHFVLHIR